MTKKLLLSVSAALLLGMAVPAVASGFSSEAPQRPLTRQEAAQLRAERNAARKVRKNAVAPAGAPVQRIMGGSNNDKPLYGTFVSTYDGLIQGWSGPVQVSASGAHKQLTSAGFEERAFSGCYFDGTYFSLQHDPTDAQRVRYMFYDAETWEPESGYVDYTLSSPHVLGSGLTYDPTTKTIYGMFYESTESYIGSEDAQLGYVSVDNALDPVSIIGDMGVRMRAMAADAEGTLYGVAYDGTIYTIDKGTAAIQEVTKIQWPDFGPDAGDPATPFFFYGNDAAVIDYETGDMYLAYSDSNDDSFIIKVDLATGATEVKANYGYYSVGGSATCDVITGLYFEQSASTTVTGTPTVPVVTDYEAVGTELKASVSFMMPSLDIDGQPLPSGTGWSVGDGKTEFASGTAEPGKEVVGAEIPVPAAGNTVLWLYAVNGEAKSNPVKIELYVGPDIPVISKKPVVIVNGQTAIVRWEAATGLNGGNLAEPQTYKVVRMPDNEVVAEAAEGTSFTDVIANEVKKEYYYLITPKAGEMVGEAVESRSAYAGSYFELPHSESFDSDVLFNQYPVIDNNHDDNIWWIDTRQGAAVFSGNDRDADDYLLIGPFSMKAKSMYDFEMTAGGHSMAEYVAVYVGNDPDDVNTFSTELIPSTMLDPMTTGDLRLSGSYQAVADGEYYFAVKACSKAYSQNLYIYDVKVSEISSAAPSMPAVSATPKAASALLNIILPATAIDGVAPANVTALRIYRDNTLVGEVTEGLADGATVEWEDTEAVSDGYHSYKVAAVNAAGEGLSKAFDLYRGLDIPNTPRNLRVVEDLSTPGLMHITWDAPENGYRGGYVNPDEITYVADYMTDNGASAVVENISTTSHDIQIDGQGKQGTFSVSVYGVNAAGSNRMSWNTRTAYYGAALPLPVRESWNDMSQHSGIWAGEAIVDVQELFESYWDIITGENSDKTPQDSDGGMLGCSTTVPDGGYRIRTPRMDVSTAENPTLVFYYLYTTDIKEYRLEVFADDQPVRTLKSLDVDPANAGKWIRQEISLADLKECKYVQFAFAPVSKVPAVEFACLDNVSITDFVGKDLEVVDFTAPTKANVNETITFDLSIRNNGAAEVSASDYVVKFYKNNTLVAEKTGVAVAADAMASMQITDEVVVTDPASTEYYAEVVYAGDMLTDNNRTATKLVRIIEPLYPRVTDLQAENANGVTLTWSDPSASDMPNSPVTESFENYQKFAISDIGEWGLHDGDNAPTVVLADATGVLTYPHIGEPMAWMVFDPLEANVTAAAWSPRTGSNMLVSFQACEDNHREKDSDDWLISPELFGKAQTISFYARAGMKAYAPETIDIMYSTTGNAVSDFKTLQAGVEVPYSSEEWPEFLFDLPEGTRYFAIVHKSYNGLAVLLDDLTYIPVGSTPETIQLLGYNVYRDGEKLNAELVGDTQFVDTDVEEGKSYTYYVTAVWDKGESALSNAVAITVSQAGISNADMDGLRIYASRGAVRIDGGTGQHVAVFTTAGACIATAVAEGNIEVPVAAAGVYIVKVGGSVKKIAVK